MLRIIFLFFLGLAAIINVEAQSLLKSYHLGDENKLYKVSDDNPASNSISDIITFGDTVWLGTSRGVSLSTNRGLSWTNFYQTPAFGTESISAIGFDKSSGTFWASTAHSIDKDGQSLPEGSGLRFTTDGGQTWKTIPQPVDDPSDSLLVYGINDGVNLPKVRALPITVTPQNIVYDIAFTPNTIWITTWAGCLRKSTDNGNSWQRVLLPPDFLNSLSPTDTVRFSLQPQAGKFGNEAYLNHVAFSVVSINDSTLYVGTAGGINKSTDNGISWKKFTHTNQSFPISGNFIVALAYNKNDNTIWGATWKAQGQTEFYGISSSSDGGETWQTFLEDEKAHNFGFKIKDVIVPTDNGVFRAKYEVDQNYHGTIWIIPASILDDSTRLFLSTNEFYSAGSQGNDIWLGSNDGLARITENPEKMWEGKWKLNFASQKLSSLNESYAYPNPFSPKVDEGVNIKYSTGGKSSVVTIRIFDFSFNYVATVIQNVNRGDPIHVVDGLDTDLNGVIDTWFGRNDTGNIVPNGVYFYRIEIGDRDPLYGKIIVMQ